MYERGDPNGQPMAVSTLLWTGSAVEFQLCALERAQRGSMFGQLECMTRW